jgi:rubredoxin
MRNPVGVSSDAAPLLRYRCDGCGYGASRRATPERCPMCGGAEWQEEWWKPFADLTGDLAPLADVDTPLARDVGGSSVFPGVPLH